MNPNSLESEKQMKEERKWYIYKITNLINGKIYIGKTYNIKVRWNSHKTAARAKKPTDYSHLHRAMNKYGFDNFTVEMVEEFAVEKDCLAAEISYIAKYGSMDRNVGYNGTEGGDGASGQIASEESRRKMSIARQGMYVGEKNPFYGKTHTEETRALISKLAKERAANDKEKCDALNIAQCAIKLEDCLKIQQQYLDGNVGIEQLAKMYNTHGCTIGKIIHGIYKAIEGHSIITDDDIARITKEHNAAVCLKKRVFSPEQEKQLVSDRLSGLSIKELCAKYNVSSFTIYKYLRKNGLKGRLKIAAHPLE
jgi:group I intron endonuclease